MTHDPPLILSIDDDQDYLDAMRDILEAVGYAMVEAKTAEDGLKIYQRERPDLIVVDLMMEEVDAGIGLVKELQALGNTAPVYMLSSLGDTFTITTDAAALGLAGVFQKPIDPVAFLAVVQAKLNTPST